MAVLGFAILGAFTWFAAMLSRPLGAEKPAVARLVPTSRPRALCDLHRRAARATPPTAARWSSLPPAVATGHEDFPSNGETWDDQYASGICRNLMVAIQYAAAKVACRSARWSFGKGGAVILLGMSEQSGATYGDVDGRRRPSVRDDRVRLKLAFETEDRGLGWYTFTTTTCTSASTFAGDADLRVAALDVAS